MPKTYIKVLNSKLIVRLSDPIWRRTFLTVAVLFTAVSGPLNTADAAPEIDPAVRKFFASYCYDCHGNGLAESGLDLEKLTGDLSDRPRIARWTRIYDRVALGQMPPAGERRPDQKAIDGFLQS